MTSPITPAESHFIGWTYRLLDWPTFDQVAEATRIELGEWYRHLPHCADEKQMLLMKNITQRLRETHPDHEERVSLNDLVAITDALGVYD